METEESSSPPPVTNEALEDVSNDARWSAWLQSQPNRPSREYTGYTAVRIVASDQDGVGAQPSVHYLDPNALMPVLYATTDIQPAFPISNPIIRALDTESDLRLNQYQRAAGRNSGDGAWDHTGQIWVNRLAREQAIAAGLDISHGFKFEGDL